MKKQVIAALLTGAFVAGTLPMCAFADDLETITVAATAAPHAEILEQAKPLLEEKGYDLEVEVFADYVLPNDVVESGEMDANYFQHINYLNSFNEEQGTHLVDAGEIHYEPFGIYAGQKESLDDVEDGDTVGVPNDTTNEARALLLLEAQGWITLDPDAGITATPEDITDNPYNLEIEPFEAAQVARHIDEVSYVVLNGNYALEAGLNAGTDALTVESADSDAIAQYVNVIAVKEGNENEEKIQALVEVLKSDEIKEFIENEYSGAVVPYEIEEGAAETEADETEAE
jgi:D-methionine transport system substrate-binding protein